MSKTIYNEEYYNGSGAKDPTAGVAINHAEKKKVYKFLISKRLIGLNEYTGENRKNRYAGAKLKKEQEEFIIIEIKKQIKSAKIETPVRINYLWIEKDKRRDLDNVCFARKFIQDALVKADVLKDDGWGYIIGFSDKFKVDKEHPGVLVELVEV